MDDLFGLSSLPEDERLDVLQDVGKIIYERVILRILGVLSDADKNALDEILNAAGDDRDTLASFLKERVPQAGTFVAEETERFKKEAQQFIARTSTE